MRRATSRNLGGEPLSSIEAGTEAPRPGNRVFLALLGAVLALGAGLRLAALEMHSFWFDEVVAMRVAQAPTLKGFVEQLASLDMVGAPLHPLLLRGWTAVWGTSEASARGLSALFSVLGLGAFATASWQVFRSRAATITATALLAVCPLDLSYAMESRMYSLLAFWTISAWGLLFSYRRGGGLARDAAFGLCLVGMAYTHPLGGLMILALALGYAIDARRSMLRPGRWLTIQAAAFTAILPWVGRYLDHPPDVREAGDVAWLLTSWIGYGLGVPSVCIGALLAVSLAAWIAPSRRLAEEDSEEFRLRTGLMLTVWVAAPLLCLGAYSVFRHPILGPLRYQVFLMPGLLLAVAGAVRYRPLTVGATTASLMLVFTVPALRTNVFNDQLKPAWRGATRAVLDRSPRPVVVLAATEPHMYYATVDYYLPENVPILSLADYRERLATGSLDRAADYWLFRDALIIERPVGTAARADGTPGLPPLGEWLDFGRLTAARLEPESTVATIQAPAASR